MIRAPNHSTSTTIKWSPNSDEAAAAHSLATRSSALISACFCCAQLPGMPRPASAVVMPARAGSSEADRAAGEVGTVTRQADHADTTGVSRRTAQPCPVLSCPVSSLADDGGVKQPPAVMLIVGDEDVLVAVRSDST